MFFCEKLFVQQTMENKKVVQLLVENVNVCSRNVRKNVCIIACEKKWLQKFPARFVRLLGYDRIYLGL